MSFDEEAALIWHTTENDVVVDHRQDVFVSKQSVVGQEFYASYQSGITVNFVLALNTIDYEMTKTKDELGKTIYAKLIEYDGGVYDVIKSYDKNETTYLSCS